MSYQIIHWQWSYRLMWSAGDDPDGHRFLGEFRTRYEANFERKLLQAGVVTEEEVKERAKATYKAAVYTRKPKRDRFRRLRLDAIDVPD